MAEDVFLGSWRMLVMVKKRRREDILITPKILEAIRSTNAGFVGFLDLIRTAVLDITVSIAFRPAAFIVSPDSKTH